MTIPLFEMRGNTLVRVSPDHAERNEQIRVLREAGHQLESIGQMFGLTRERVRQIVAEKYDPRRRSMAQHCRYDPLQLLHTLRTDSSLDSYRKLATRCGTNISSCQTLMRHLTLQPAVKRLLAWRRTHTRPLAASAFARNVLTFIAEHGPVTAGDIHRKYAAGTAGRMLQLGYAVYGDPAPRTTMTMVRGGRLITKLAKPARYLVLTEKGRAYLRRPVASSS